MTGERVGSGPATAARNESGPVDLVLVSCAHEENLSVHYVAAAAIGAGFRATVTGARELAELTALIPELLAPQPRLIGLSMSAQVLAPAFIELADALREHRFTGHLCCGGHFATLAWRQLLRDVPAIDTIVLHEGEETIVELLRSLPAADSAPRPDELGTIVGLAYRDADGAPTATTARPLAALDELPWPTRVRPPSTVLGVNAAAMVGSRGCFGSCEYCSIHAWHQNADGPRYRQRSLEDVLDEMQWLRTHLQVQLFDFYDDNFFVPSSAKNQARFRGLADGLGARRMDDVAIMLRCRPDDLDEHSLSLLERIGVARVLVGVDTATPQGLRTLGRDLDLEDNRRAVELLTSRDIPVVFNLLVFDPDSTLETITMNVDFLEEHAGLPFTFGAVRVYVATPLEAKLRAAGRLRGSYLAPSYDIVDERANLAERLVDVALHRRAFHSDGLHLQTEALRLELEMRQRFYRPAPSAGLRDQLLGVVRQIGSSSVRHLRDIVDFAANVSPQDKKRIRGFARERSQLVHRDDFELMQSLLQARAALQRSVTQPGVYPRRRTLPPVDSARPPATLAR